MSSSNLIAALTVLILSAALSALCIWAIRPLLVRYAMARPNARSSHKVPTPQGAGIAVIAATLFTAGFAVVWLGPPPGIWVLFAATIVIAAVGAIDDLRPLPVGPRFALQALCVTVVLVALPMDRQIVPLLPLWLERIILIIAMLWFVNLTNFMDGLDWMTVVEVVPVAGALAVIGLAGAVASPTTFFAAALCGALLGFAPFNRPVAKMFLGDVGSLPIGLLLAWYLLQLADAGHLAAAILLPLYYLGDATVTLLRRIVRREPFWLAHRSHFYQRATDNGFRVMEVVGTVAATNVILAALAGLSIYLQIDLASGVLVAVGTAVVAFVLARFATDRPTGTVR